MPKDLRDLLSFFDFEDLTPDCIFLEKAQSFPGQGVSSAFNYGTHYGELLGLCKCLKSPFRTVAPITWTKKLHLGITGKDPKAKSLEAYRRLYPSEEGRLYPGKCKKPHDGIIDAFLIAAYGYLYA